MRRDMGALSQYKPATLNEMLDARSAAPTGAYKNMLIGMPGVAQPSVSEFLDDIQRIQVLSSCYDSSTRVYNK